MENTMFKEKTPHFFKIVLDQEKLGIPRKFVRKYGNYLSDQVFLKVPNGPKWQVDVVKNADEIWLGNGWQNFVNYYSISHGFFLVFGFENFKICCFNVMIFDKSCLEIDYPFHVNGDNEEPNLEEESHEARPCKKIKQENFTEEQSEGKKSAKRRRSLTAEEKANALDRASYKSSNPSFSIAIRQAYLSDRLVIPSSFAKKYIKKPRGDIILNSVDGKTWSVGYVNYVKENGSESTRIVYRGWRKFVKDNHLVVGDVCVFELINHNPTELSVSIFSENQEAKSIPSKGNNKNLKDNQIPCLKATNDLRDSNKFKTNLHPSYLDHHSLICSSTQVSATSMEKFKTVKSPSPKVKKGNWGRCAKRTKSLTVEEKASVLDRARRYYKSNHPSFSILMQPTHVGECDDRYKVVIPALYARTYFKKQKGNIILNSVDGKTWSVEYVNCKRSKGSDTTVIRGGWRKFVLDNHLAVGDVCVFELINNDSTKLLVVICRGNQEPKRIPSKASTSNIYGQM